MIDLHTHTVASDGSLTLSELIAQAREAGLRAIAVTDHDNVKSAKEITGKEPIEAIPGVELSVFDHAMGYEDVHVLGLFIDPHDGALNIELDKLLHERDEQKRETIAILNRMGYEITFEEVRSLAKWGIGRPHIARVLVQRYPKEFPSVQDAFDRLLGEGRPAYAIRKNGFGLGEAISLIRKAGGISVLAHPFLYPYDADRLVSDFRRLGGAAIETYYDYATNAPRRGNELGDLESLHGKAAALAAAYGLLESGGSDFHGESKGQRLGAFGAPVSLLGPMRALLRTIRKKADLPA